MPANRCSAFASLALGCLLSASACVDLTLPKTLVNGGGGQGGTSDSTPLPTAGIQDTGGETTGAPGGETMGGAGGLETGGVGGTTTGDTGGADAGGRDGAAAGGTGGVATGGSTGGRTTGASADGSATGGVAPGDAGGVATGGRGGTATGGTTATGGSTRRGDGGVPPDLRPSNEVAAPIEVAPLPDTAIDTPAIPDAGIIADVAPIPDVAQVADAPADTPPIIPGLVLYYSCEEVSGTTLPDMSGNGNNGTLVGPFTVAAGQVGNALLLTANNADAPTSGGYVVMPPKILAGSSTMTIATWFKINSTLAFQRIFDIGTSDTTSSMYLTPRDSANPSNLRFSIRMTLADGGLFKEDLQAAPVKTIPTNTWEHVAVVLDASGGRLYLNGQQVGVNTAMTMRPTTLGDTPSDWIGRSEFAINPYLDGAIDEFRIYNRALSAAEISALYSGH